MPRHRIAIAAVIILLVAALVSLPSPATAQGVPTSQFQTTAGGYEIGVAEFSSTLSVGSARILVTLRDESTGEGIGDARVVVRVKHELSGEETSVRAVNSPNTPDRYRAQVSLKSPGTWRLWVEVDGRLGKVAVEVVPLEIPALRSFSSGSFVFIGVFLVLVLGVTYVWWTSQKALKRRRISQGLPDDSIQGTGSGTDGGGQ